LAGADVEVFGVVVFLVAGAEALGTGVEDTFSVVVGFFRRPVETRSISPAKPFFAGVFPALVFSDGAGFFCAMSHLVQCSRGSSKTLVKSFGL
jgi:hypothetical protein